MIKFHGASLDEKRIILYEIVVPHPATKISKNTQIVIVLDGGVEKVFVYGTREEAERGLLKLDEFLGTKPII